MFNNNVQIYIGDLKYNPDSHRFIEDFNSIFVMRFDIMVLGHQAKIDFVDIDYLDLNAKQIASVVENSKRKVLLSTLFPEKIDTKLECKINYKDHIIKKNELKIYDMIKIIFNEKNRMKVFAMLMQNDVNVHMLNNWLQSNPNESNLGMLMKIDRYVHLSSPALFLSLVAFNITSGPSYITYAFKKNSG